MIWRVDRQLSHQVRKPVIYFRAQIQVSNFFVYCRIMFSDTTVPVGDTAKKNICGKLGVNNKRFVFGCNLCIVVGVERRTAGAFGEYCFVFVNRSKLVWELDLGYVVRL